MKVQVAPIMWEWACRRGGLDEQDLLSEFPKLLEWKTGDAQPTLKQLEQFAKKNHVPLGMLFLEAPPVENLPIPDFRTIKNTSINTPSQNLLDTIYLCQQRQNWYAQYLSGQGFSENELVGCVTRQDSVIEVAKRMRDLLSFGLEERQQFSKWEDTLRFFVEQVRKLNILVMTSGIVANNTHRSLDPDEFRGFVLIDRFSPLIFINGKDTKSAQIFTLAHELAHIWLGSEGISNIQVTDIDHQKANELWCNQVASELLVPLADLQNKLNPHINPNNVLANELERLAKIYKVSSLVIIRRLYDLNFYNYEVFLDTYKQEWERLKPLLNKGKQGGGGDFYRSLNMKVGNQFLQALVSSTLEGKTLFRDAFRLLSINKSETFYNITI